MSTKYLEKMKSELEDLKLTAAEKEANRIRLLEQIDELETIIDKVEA